MYRHSILDLVEGGNSWDEVKRRRASPGKAGVTLFNTGIGWHEARVPTIVTSVPRAAFASVSGRLKQAVSIPRIASNRINMPAQAEEIIASGTADMVSMARPSWLIPNLLTKLRRAASMRSTPVSRVIRLALDHTFSNQRASCLVNPRAAHETELVYTKPIAKRIAVVGGDQQVLSAATVAASCGHDVSLFDSSDSIGGQFKIAKSR